MGDMSELKPLVTIGVFTASLIFLILQVPVALYDTDYASTIRTLETNDYWDASVLQDYADTNVTVVDPDLTWARWNDLPDYSWANLFSQRLDDGTDDGKGIDFGGYTEVWLLSRYTLNTSEGRIYIAYPHQRFLGAGWVTKWGYAEWYFDNGTSILHNDYSYGENRQINKNILRDYWEEPIDENNPGGGQKNQTSFRVKMTYEEKQVVWFDVHFSFNTSLYGDPRFAWDNSTGNPVPDDLWILSGINFNQERTTYDAWGLIAGILFFNLPSVLVGTPAFIGYILSIIVWIPLVYVAFILILRSIGALFGGGA